METKNYESRLEEAKKLYQTANADQKYLLESLFPEIIEDEDERVRKVLLDVCDMSLPDIWVKRGIEKEQVIAWLGKQGNETKVSYTTIVETGDGGINALVTKELPTDGCDDEQKPADMLEPKDYSSIDPHFFKPADKVEPKFKIEKGKWYVCIRDLLDNYANKAFHKGDTYLSTQDGSLIPSNSNVPFEVVCPDTYFRNWDISDAKDGDVLYSPCLSLLWIFKSRDTIYCGCNLNYNDGAFCGEGYFERPTDAIPATKEQRDILFSKMKEAGYEWDADKKELKKKSQRMVSAEAKEALYDKPTWSKEDERMINTLINIFEVNYPDAFYKLNPIGTTDMQAINSYEIVKWLKSLKEKYTWKPSDEQMEVLLSEVTAWTKGCPKQIVLESLYNDLKNL